MRGGGAHDAQRQQFAHQEPFKIFGTARQNLEHIVIRTSDRGTFHHPIMALHKIVQPPDRRLGMIDRFTIYVSNLLPAGVAGGLAAGEYAMYAGHSHGLTFASQVSKVETLRSEMTFGNILRGLQVYGYKVIDGTAISQAIVAKG